MDYFVKTAIEALGPSATPLDKGNIAQMKQKLPIPKEYTVLWADVNFSTRTSGIVFTKEALIIRADKETLRAYNNSVTDKKQRKDSIYHLIKWEYFDGDELKVEVDNEKIRILYGSSEMLNTSTSELPNFVKSYKEEYEKFIKASLSAPVNIFAELEAVEVEGLALNATKYGHGKMAENANNMLDQLHGKDAQVVGGDNAKDGPDRIVDGIHIQSKYAATGKKCVNSCFDKATGQYRYYNKDGTPMVLEVPKDKYMEALEAFRQKILDGKVPGVTNPDDATDYVKQGRLTYQQARNLCKPGTIESLTYDAATGIITCGFAFGISVLATYALTLYQTGDKKGALQEALIAGIQVFGLSFFSHILISQIARTNLTKSLIPMSNFLVQKLGYKATQAIVNAIRNLAGKKAISGAAASKQLAKIMRSNALAAGLTLIVFSGPECYNLFSKKISKAQFTKNMLTLVATMASAGAGTLGTALITAKIGAKIGTIKPGVGTAIGLAGGFIGGLAGGTAVKALGDYIREDDSIIMSRMFNGIMLNMIYDYLLSEDELDKVIEKLNAIKPRLFQKLFKTVHASGLQEKAISDFLSPHFEAVIGERVFVSMPAADDIAVMLEDFARNNENKGNGE